MSDVVVPARPVVIETDPSSSFTCDYLAGINRVLSFPPYLLVDNIGRNFEIWCLARGEREPSARTRYDCTSYPGDPIASLLDVDLHAAFVRRDGRELMAVNHYGLVRAFELPSLAPQMHAVWEVQLLGDTERIVMVADCFITSSPRGEFTDDPSQPGIFLFEPLAAEPAQTSGGVRQGCVQALADWGVVSALAVSANGNRLAVAAGHRVGVFTLMYGRGGLRLGDCRWEAALNFDCQLLHFEETERLWAGGASTVHGGRDADTGCGGGVESFAVEDGARLFTARLPDATAWGYGAEPLVIARGGRAVYVLGRDAALHVIDVTSGESRQLYKAPAMLDGAAPPSLGIGHAALHDGRLYAGFSRGGFWLLRYELARS